MKHAPLSTPRLLPIAAITLGLLVGCGADDPQQLLASARQYQASNDPTAAIIQLKNALQAKPDLADARFLLGQALLQTGDALGAETELRKARDLGHPQDELAPLLARALMAQGKFGVVTGELGSLSLSQPLAQADLRTLVAAAWRQQGNMQAARSALKEALAVQPEHAPAWIEQARAQSAERDFDAALASLQTVLTQSPKHDEALRLKGDVLLFGKHDAPGAMEVYRAALQANPDSTETRTATVRALIAAKKVDDASKEIEPLIAAAPRQPQTLYLQAQLAFLKDDLAAASGFAQQLLARSPDSPIALEINGAIEFRLGSMVKAEASLARALQAAPQLVTARRVLLMTYLRTGQIDQAIAGLPADIERNDGDAAMLAVAGQAYMVKGDLERAEQFFTRASQVDPADPAKQTSLAISQLMRGKASMAIGALENIAAADPGAAADLALVNAFMQRKEVDKALQAIAGLEKKLAQDPMPRLLKGRALLVRGDRAGARLAFEQALSLAPDYFAATAALSALDVLDGKPQDARARLDELIKKDPKHTQALMALAELRAGQRASAQEVESLLSRAVESAPLNKVARLRLIDQQLRQSEPKKAMSTAQSAVASLPDAPELLDGLGRAQLASGDANQAISSFNRLVTLMPHSTLPFMRLASVHAAGKHSDAAVQALKRALEIQPQYLPAQRGLVELTAQSGDAAQALSIAKTVQKQRPQEGVGFALEGDVLAQGKNWAGAAQAYRRGLNVVASSELAIKLHTVLVAAGQTADAARVAGDWAKSQPKDVSFPLYLGDRALAASQWPEAAKQYERVLGLQGDNALALNNLAWVAGRLARPDAVALAEKANRLAPDQPAFMDTLAVLLSDANQHERAIALQKKALALQPNTASIKLNLAKIYLKAGDKSAARQVLQELSALGDAFGGQAEVQAMLGQS